MSNVECCSWLGSIAGACAPAVVALRPSLRNLADSSTDVSGRGRHYDVSCRSRTNLGSGGGGVAVRSSDFTTRGFFSERSLRSVDPSSGSSAPWRSDVSVGSTGVHAATARRKSRKAPQPVREDFLFPQSAAQRLPAGERRVGSGVPDNQSVCGPGIFPGTFYPVSTL